MRSFLDGGIFFLSSSPSLRVRILLILLIFYFGSFLCTPGATALATTSLLPLLLLVDIVVRFDHLRDRLGLLRKWLQELPWLWLLVASNIGDLEFDFRKSDTEAGAHPLPQILLAIIDDICCHLLLVPAWHIPADEFVLLVQEWHARLDDLASLHGLCEILLEGVESHCPVLPDLVQ